MLFAKLARIGADHHGDHADDDGCRDRDVALRTEQAGNAAADAKKRERADTGDAAAGLFLAQFPATLDSDQQPTGERRRDRQRLPVPDRVQRNRSACQARCSAMKVDMK